MTALSFVIPRKMAVSSNDRLHWRAEAKLVADLREVARLHALAENVQPVSGVVDAVITIHWPDKRRRDAPNMWPTVKPLIDGITDAGVLEDDSDVYVRRTVFQAGAERSALGTVALHISLEEAT